MIAARARLLCATSVIALTSISTGLHAQSASESEFLGTVILGELQTRTVQDSPTSAVVETGENLEERGDADVYDLIERTPNVSTTFGNKGFVLRGIQTNGAVNNVQLNGTLVSVQVDGVALNNYQSTFFGPYSSWDLDQVEVLRGPQSTQQGRNALAGAIIFNTRDPEFFSEYRLRVEGGSRDLQRFAFAWNEPLGDDFAFRVAAETSSEDGYVRSETLDDDNYDAREYDAYRAKLRWQPSDNFDAVVEYSYTDSKGGEDYVLESEFPARRITNQNSDATEGSIHKSFGITTTYNINSTLTLETETNFYEQDYLRVEGNDPVGIGESLLTIDGGSKTFEQDVQLGFEAGRFTGVAGLFYTETSDERPLFTELDLALLGAPGLVDTSDSQFDTEVENFAIYAETDIDLGDYVQGLSATVGARYDKETFTYTQSVDFGPFINGSGVFDVPENSASRDFEAFLPKLGVTYDFSEDQSVSFTVQRAYRAGGVAFNFVEALRPDSDGLNQYEPEKSTNFELAYRGSFNNDTLRIGGNVFFTQWDDMQISVPGLPTGTTLDSLFNFSTSNAAKSELYGFELSVESEPNENLELFGSVGYTHTEFTNFISGEFDAVTPGLVNEVDYSGNQFPFSPEWTANLGGKYTWDNGFALALDASYKSESFQDNANSYTDDERWLFNAHATYDLSENLTAGLYVRNLLDEDYATARFESAGQPTIIRTGEPRTIGAYVQAEF